ncbi:MAG: hypothetical protein GQE15_35125 [Archangiaceae bacterium]|nr:hypothetical protein [Archangiaceae bacterium]
MMTRLCLLAVLAICSCSKPCDLSCSNEVRVQLGAAAQQFKAGEPVEVRACVGVNCRSEVLTRPVPDHAFGSESFTVLLDGTMIIGISATISNTEPVTLEFKRMGNTVLSESRTAVTFTDFATGSLGCGTCRTATISL